ncbi:hypothetical protein PPACK8108_LOCUS23964 [Phakopsora pachyrhizi]|uniref:Uncharacterized protein n=1 Tax=Phakopsora pachyrhizi TaxID=170000 RepID=A0AAV0BNP8_PHAPC|nr:hypothetical protein PPACK8108_LOCUS23964 [Phakopsora pachyrhizi]
MSQYGAYGNPYYGGYYYPYDNQTPYYGYEIPRLQNFAGVAGWLKMPLFKYAIANHLRRPLYSKWGGIL